MGRPRSENPVTLPMDEAGAHAFRTRNRGRSFWCGTLLGGCGGRLSDKIYQEKACHFAHHPSSNGCTRRYGGADSADHLYASGKLNRWLEQQGWDQRPPRYEGDFAAGGTCARVLLDEAGDLPAICIEFSPDLDACLRRLLHAGEINRLDWLVKNNPHLTNALIDRNGYALRIRFKDEDLGRGSDIGTMTGDLRIRWNDLSECSFTPDGIHTPVLEDRRRLRLIPDRSQPKPAVSEPGDRLTALRRLVHDALDNEDPHSAGQAIDTIALRMAEFPEEVQSELRARLIDLQKVTGMARPHIRAERLLQEWGDAANAGRWQYAREVQRELKGLLQQPGNGLTGEQRRRISSRLGMAANAPGHPANAVTVSRDERVHTVARDLETAARDGDHGRADRLRKRALALKRDRAGGITAAHQQRLDQAIAKANKTLKPPRPTARQKRRGSDSQRRGSSTTAAGESAPDPAEPDSSPGMDETLHARSEEIRHQLRREGRTPGPPAAGAAPETGENSSDATADPETLRTLTEKISSRRSR